MSLAIKASRAGVRGGGFGVGGTLGSVSRAATLIARGGIAPPGTRLGSQGDPGLFGFLGKAAGFIGSAITGGAAGVVGSIAGAIAQQTNPPAGPGAVSFPTSGGFFPSIGQLQSQEGQRFPVGIPKPGFLAAGQRLIPSGETGLGGGCNVGFHANKSDYFLKDGTFIRKGTVCVKNRRRNPLNPRAASRAIGRLEAAKKATSSLNRISIKCRRCKKVSCSCG